MIETLCRDFLGDNLQLIAQLFHDYKEKLARVDMHTDPAFDLSFFISYRDYINMAVIKNLTRLQVVDQLKRLWFARDDGKTPSNYLQNIIFDNIPAKIELGIDKIKENAPALLGVQNLSDMENKVPGIVNLVDEINQDDKSKIEEQKSEEKDIKKVIKVKKMRIPKEYSEDTIKKMLKQLTPTEQNFYLTQTQRLKLTPTKVLQTIRKQREQANQVAKFNNEQLLDELVGDKEVDNDGDQSVAEVSTTVEEINKTPQQGGEGMNQD